MQKDDWPARETEMATYPTFCMLGGHVLQQLVVQDDCELYDIGSCAASQYNRSFCCRVGAEVHSGALRQAACMPGHRVAGHCVLHTAFQDDLLFWVHTLHCSAQALVLVPYIAEPLQGSTTCIVT